MELAAWVEARASALRATDPWKDAVTVRAPEHPGGGYVIDIDGTRVIAQFIVWTNGAIEATAGAVSDGQLSYSDAAPKGANIDAHWTRFYEEIVRIEGAGR